MRSTDGCGGRMRSRPDGMMLRYLCSSRDSVPAFVGMSDKLRSGMLRPDGTTMTFESEFVQIQH